MALWRSINGDDLGFCVGDEFIFMVDEMRISRALVEGWRALLAWTAGGGCPHVGNVYNQAALEVHENISVQF